MKVILISLDTLCSSHLSCYGYRLETTPQIDRWAADAALFERCYSSDVPTPPSYTAMLSGRFGIHNGIFGFQDPSTYRPGPPMVQRLLANAGWETCALSNLFYACSWLLDGWQTMIPPGLRFQGGRAPDVTDRAIRWLKEHQDEDDLFLFVHYWEPHQPYKKAPDEHRRLFPADAYEGHAPGMGYIDANPIMRSFYREYHRRGEDAPDLSPAEVMARYDAQIHFVDEHVGRLLAHLEESGVADSAAVILTSDHGEAFGEYGSFDHMTCYENIAHVPLLVRLPDAPAGTRVPGFVYGADLMPTILGLAGLEPPDGLDGRSLLPALRDGAPTPHEFIVTDCNALVAQRMIVRDHWALAHTLFAGPFDHMAPNELFDVNGDPERDLLSEQPDVASDLRETMDAWLTEKLAGLPDPLQKAALEGGWTLNHPCLLHGVLSNLEQARANTPFWDVLCRKHGPALARLTGLMPGLPGGRG